MIFFIGIVELYAGNRETANFRESIDGTLHNSSFSYPSSICADPTRKNHYFITDDATIRCSDGINISTIAGGQTTDFRDGIGSAASFHSLMGSVLTGDGRTLYVTDFGNMCLRAVDVKSGQVTTIAGDGQCATRDGMGTSSSLYAPNKCVFYSSPKVKPESVLFISSALYIRRFDIESCEVSTLNLKTERVIFPVSLACTSNGVLLFSCSASHSFFAVDPFSCEVEKIAGTGQEGFRDGDALKAEFSLEGLNFCLDEKGECLWVAFSSTIRCVTLPPYLFSLA